MQPRGRDFFEVQGVLEKLEHIADVTRDDLFAVQEVHSHKAFK